MCLWFRLEEPRMSTSINADWDSVRLITGVFRGEHARFSVGGRRRIYGASCYMHLCAIFMVIRRRPFRARGTRLPLVDFLGYGLRDELSALDGLIKVS